MKLLIATMTTLLTLSAFAADCTYTIKAQDVKLKWTAFKTPLKKGVSGTFNKYGIKKRFQGKSLKNTLTSVRFNIDASSVNTKHEARDKKLSKFFFALMNGKKISGKMTSYNKKVLTVQITMNGVTKDVPLAVKINANEMNASGYIDIFDFSMGKSLNSINKACFKLHQGKTWSDVKLELKAKYLKSCN